MTVGVPETCTMKLPSNEQRLSSGSLSDDSAPRKQTVRENQKGPIAQVFLNSLTVAEICRRTANVTDDRYREAFRKGIPMFYHDMRTTRPNEFIRANPDGSEDLVCYDIATRGYTLTKHLLPAGKGRWAYLSCATK